MLFISERINKNYTLRSNFNVLHKLILQTKNCFICKNFDSVKVYLRTKVHKLKEDVKKNYSVKEKGCERNRRISKGYNVYFNRTKNSNKQNLISG